MANLTSNWNPFSGSGNTAPTASGTLSVTTAGAVPPGNSMLQGWGQTSQQTGMYPQAIPSQQPYMLHVPVIPESYPDKLHFQTSDGSVHSFSVEHVYRALGLKW